jgi:hypothetical protein
MLKEIMRRLELRRDWPQPVRSDRAGFKRAMAIVAGVCPNLLRSRGPIAEHVCLICQTCAYFDSARL